ncbi:MAG: hypothetical protein AAFQ82_03945 [Myxococcota bacterium]
MTVSAELANNIDNQRVERLVSEEQYGDAISLGEQLVLQGQATPKTLLQLAVAHTLTGSLKVAAAHLRHALQTADGERDAAVIAEGCHWAQSVLMPQIAAAD